ncbi:MAG: DUF4382 domain-containing protein [Deltaproteobacteria bacterium]|nr:DUF4382 domain-containing protein [Deltaproteobacteria bacterium]
MAVRVTDAAPLLPQASEQLFVAFEGVKVLEEGGQWRLLPMIESPYVVDMLELNTGRAATMVPAGDLAAGSYTHLRILLSQASIVVNGVAHQVEIPPGEREQILEYYFELQPAETLDLTVDLVLSESLQVVHRVGHAVYELQPVFHVNQTEKAAIIRGEVSSFTFDELGCSEITASVIADTDRSGSLSAADEEYTRVVISEHEARFSIFWLAPLEGYTVRLLDCSGREVAFEEFVYPADLQEGDVFELNKGVPI